MTATTLLVSLMLVGQTSTLPVPVAPSSARRFGSPAAIVASPANDEPVAPADDGMRSVLAVRETGRSQFAAPVDDLPESAVEPVSAQPVRGQPTAAPPQSPNPPGLHVLGGRSGAVTASANQPLGQEPAAGQGLAKRLVTQAFLNGPAEDPSAIVEAGGTLSPPGGSSSNVSLRAALATTTDRARQMAIIKTYWEASSLLADWQFAREELQLVDDLPAPRSTADQASLAAAQTAAQARFVEAEMASITARFALADATGLAGDAPPMPTDLPFVGKYRTEFDTIFVGRAAPLGVKRIHATLPLRRELVDARAAAVVAGVNSLDEQIGAYRSGQLPLAQVLSSMNALRLQRGAFLGAVRDYNLDIAEYALAAAQPSDPPEKIVAMLIEVEPSEEPRSVLVAPPTARVLEPAGNTFAAPAQLTLPTRFAAPTISSGNELRLPAGSAISQPAIASRPSTERVLGSFRDVTNETPSIEAEVRPRSSFGDVDQPSDLPPSLPPR
jgi:hypothetical protein